MNGATAGANAIRKARNLCVLSALLLVGWQLYASASDFYRIKPPSVRRFATEDLHVKPGTRHERNRYLGMLQQREMFRQSVIYETKQNQVVDVLGELTFLGVVQTGGTPKAFILNIKTNVSSLISEGETFGDLTAQQIKSDRIIFKHGAESLELIR